MSDARKSARRILCFGPDSANWDARFELIRATVWTFSSHGVLPYVAKMINTSLPSWRLLRNGPPDTDEETLRKELRTTLEMLGRSGDIIEVAGGRWTAATTRVVKLDHGAADLLVGGAPLSRLPVSPAAVRHHGPYRYIQRGDSLSAALPEEDLATWARLPDLPLLEWAQDLRDSLERVPYRPATQESFEFYLPTRARAAVPQFRRWSAEPADARGTLLARRTRLFGAREYRLVDVERGRIVRTSELPTSEARRLMYALDFEAGTCVQARCTTLDKDRIEIVLASELPREEQRVLAALGQLDIPAERRFERRWTFRRAYVLALKLLRDLGIEVVGS
jgi:hypothetical protein